LFLNPPRGIIVGNKQPKLPTENYLMKLEIAEELGLMDKVAATGWKSLTARESGRIGGLMTKRKKEQKAKESAKA